jgi:hypothetical protein
MCSLSRVYDVTARRAGRGACVVLRGGLKFQWNFLLEFVHYIAAFSLLFSATESSQSQPAPHKTKPYKAKRPRRVPGPSLIGDELER